MHEYLINPANRLHPDTGYGKLITKAYNTDE